MKKYLLLLLTFLSLTTFAQIEVKEGSFHKIQGYVMLEKEEHVDMNNAPMALIKISTENITAEQRRKFTFRGNAITYFDVIFEPGEIHLYISAAAATFLEIIHDDYGKTEYTFPETLCGYCGYEMVVQYKPYQPEQEVVKPKNNFLTINVVQPGATIYIDDEYVGIKSVEKSLLIGKRHTYRVECDLYHEETGTIDVTEGDPIELNVDLRPAHGFLNIDSSPEQGAMVYIDGKNVGKTPYKSNKMASGTYKVRVLKTMYTPSEQTCVVSDGETTELKLDMSANYVNVTINTDAQSDIYVDEEFKAKGSWKGRISDGVHFVEARKDKHKSVSKNITFTIGKDEVVTLDAPTPINGFLELTSTPSKADIYIDGKHCGQTPRVIYDLLIGSHELRLEKEGCAPLIKTINIEEEVTLTLKETLQTGKIITVSTDAEGDKIYVDDVFVGKSPVECNLAYGTHEVKAERYGQYVSKTINVAQNGGDNVVKVLFGKSVTIKSDRTGCDVYIDGRRVGVTPYTGYLTHGIHTVKVSCGNQFATEDIEVSERGYSTFTIEVGQTIDILSTKSGDKVIVDGKKMGKTPLKLNLSLGKHSVLVKRGKKTDKKTIDLTGDAALRYKFYPSRDYPFWSAVGGAFGDVGYFIGESFEDIGYFFGNMFEGGYFSVSGGYKSFMGSSDNYYSLGLDLGGFFIDEFGIFATATIWGYSWSVVGGFNFDISWLGTTYEGFLGRVGMGYTFSHYSKSSSHYVQGIEYLFGLALGDDGIFVNMDMLTTNFETLELRIGIGWRW